MTDRWTGKIDDVTSAFKQTFGALTVEQLNRKPNEQTWSIAQNIDHLIVINKSYFPVIEAIHNGEYKVPFIGKFGLLVNLLGKTILQGVEPGRRKKTKTFPIWEPTSGKIPIDILTRFDTHQSALKELILNSMDLLDRGAVISSPANKNIVYKLEIAFDIIVTHEERHFQQAKDIMQILR